MEWTLWASGLTALAAALLFIRLGLRLRAADASRPFTIWWMAIGAATAAYGLRVLAGGAGFAQAVVVLLAAGIALSGLAVWGLIAYIGHIYTGRPAASRAAAAVYGLAAPGTVAYIIWGAPHEVAVQQWTVDAVATGPVAPVLTLLFLVPPFVAGLLVLRLVPRAQDMAQRRRMLAVGLGIPAWFSLHLVARLSDADAWQFFTRVLLGIAVAMAIWWAYRTGPGATQMPRRAPTALEQRIRALV